MLRLFVIVSFSLFVFCNCSNNKDSIEKRINLILKSEIVNQYKGFEISPYRKESGVIVSFPDNSEVLLNKIKTKSIEILFIDTSRCINCEAIKIYNESIEKTLFFNEMNDLERAEFGIMLGVLAGIALVIYDFAPIILYLIRGRSYPSNVFFILAVIFVLLLSLIYGIYRKSRIASIMLFILVIFTKIRYFKNISFLDYLSSLSFYNFLIPCFIFFSIIGTFKYHRVKKNVHQHR